MSRKVLVTPRSFGKANPLPAQMLRERGYELIMNPYGRIMTEEEMSALVADVDGIVIGVDPLNSNVLAKASKLKAIAKYGVGTNNIDLDYARAHGVDVTIGAGANTDAVADYAIALMLAVSRRVVQIDARCRQRNWEKITTFGMWGKTLGLIGMGAIGKGVALRAKGFNMKLLAYDVVQDAAFAEQTGLEYTSVERILAESDFISMHVPLTPQTKGMIGEAELRAMKPSAVLINTARGGIIDEDALLQALKNNVIYGAGLDVFETEPPENEEWYRLDNLVMGSHCAASTQEAVDNMGIFAARNLIRSLEGDQQ